MTDQTFALTMLKAGKGDAIWITVGGDDDVRHILVDTGLASTAPVLKAQVEAVELKYGKPVVLSLLILTHIDADHINGAEYFLRNLKALRLSIKALWFNGYRQVFEVKKGAADTLGADQAERISAWAETLGIPLNPGLDDDCPLTTASYTDLDLGALNLPDGFVITLLGPGPERIEALRRKWSGDMGGKPGTAFNSALTDVLGATKFGDDDSKANGSSITFLIEYAGASVLMTSDAFAPDLKSALQALPGKRLHYFKLSHHGSSHNVSAELIQSNLAPNYLVSGSVTHNETIKLVHNKRPDAIFHFNYPAPRTNASTAVPGILLSAPPGDLGHVIDLLAPNSEA